MNQHAIVRDMKVSPEINIMEEITSRIDFIKDTMADAGIRKLVLGISGGVDSTLAGRLCQLAVDELNRQSKGFQFIAVRLPHGTQADEDDAQEALAFIKPSRSVRVDIREAVSMINCEVLGGLGEVGMHPDWDDKDFAKGNVKARMRMIAQYQIAGLVGALVVGTDHSAEAVSGFYTKFGDGACDFTPLFGLNKRQVRAMAERLGAPKRLWAKEATADLEDGKPQLSDEVALGVTYDQIDDFLEGKKIDKEAEQIIVGRYIATEHKRNLPVSPV